jgi:hypothetical protein
MGLITLVTDTSIWTKGVYASSIAAKIWYCITLIDILKRKKTEFYRFSSLKYYYTQKFLENQQVNLHSSSSLATLPFLSHSLPLKILPDLSWIRPFGFHFFGFCNNNFLWSKVISLASSPHPGGPKEQKIIAEDNTT